VQFNLSAVAAKSSLDKTKSIVVKGMTLLKKDSLEEEKEKLGRYWIW
jgi:hypothetical protein